MTDVRELGSADFRARQREQEVLAAFFASASAGRGGAVVVHGDAGIGKTALLEHSLSRSAGLRTLRANGAEFEMELPYAALHQLCAPVIDRRRQLPAPQCAALESVFGLRDEEVADPFLVGLAVLGLFAEVSHAAPLICVVDDMQWIDSGSKQALIFAARRVESERVAFVFGLRDPASVPQLAGFERLRITGLSDADARALLTAEVRVPLDEEVRDRIVAEAHGNPLALLELPRGVGPLELAGGFGGLSAHPVPRAVEENFAQRVAGLPPDARTLLVLAAAEPLGDPALLRRAADAVGLGPEAAESAEDAGLLHLGTTIRFRHPLVRSAAYWAATLAERRRAHAALAAATDQMLDPDRRVWHLAQAAVEPDEDVAGELERSSDRARARGGLAAASAFLERAAELTPDAPLRAGRMLAAARTTLRAGAPEAALDLLERAESGPLTDRERAHVRLLRALLAFRTRRDADATIMLLDAAEALEPDLARETYLEAFASAMFIDRLPGQLRELAKLVSVRAPSREPPRPVDLLLDAVTAQATLDDPVAIPVMQRAVRAFQDASEHSSADPRWMDLACNVASDLHDSAALRSLADRQVGLARRQGALAVLPEALNYQAVARVVAGDFTGALASVAEGNAVMAATGSVGLPFGDVIVASWRGDEARVDALFDALRATAGSQDMMEELSRSVLYNGLSEYQKALDVALRAEKEVQLGSYGSWHLAPELVEAAVRLGQPEAAARALGQIVVRAETSGTDWAVGQKLRARALIAEGSDGADADGLYVEAIARFVSAGTRTHVARTQLVYGEWLRRQRRRVEARDQLREAYEALSAIGAEGFAERASRELLATGEHPRKRSVDLLDALTAQELHIARHVASGATSKEVAAELFLSPRTIDAHLRSVFRKLGISSRRQLKDLVL